MKIESVYRQPALKEEDDPEVYPVVHYVYPRIKHNKPLYLLLVAVVLVVGLMFVWFAKV